MKRSRILIIVLAIALALITTFFLYRYLEDLRKEPEVKVIYQDTVVASVDILAQTELTADMLKVISLPQEAIHPRALSKIEDLVGFITVTSITADEQVLTSKLALEDGTSGLSYQIPEHMRAIVVPTREVSGLAGYLMKGDKVDLLVTYFELPGGGDISEPETDQTGNNTEATQPAEEVTDTDVEPAQAVNDGVQGADAGSFTFTITQFQNLEVLEIGVAAYVGANGEIVKSVGVPSSVTLLVTPEQAEIIVYMLNTATFQMSLRNPTDNATIPLDHYGDDNFAEWRER